MIGNWEIFEAVFSSFLPKRRLEGYGRSRFHQVLRFAAFSVSVVVSRAIRSMRDEGW